MRKSVLLFLLLSLAFLPLMAQVATGPQAVRNQYVKREVRIPMRDGVELFTAVYEPRDHSQRHPILLVRTCYQDDVLGEENFKDLTAAAYLPYFRSHYIFVFQDVRGKNMSGGTFEDVRPFNPLKGKKDTDEASDTYDTAEWLVHNTYSNGNIGVYGISYRGFYATLAALSGHPAIKAVSPQAPVTDWYRGDDFHHNGALCQVDISGFAHSFQYMQTSDVRSGKLSRNTLRSPRFVTSDVYSDFLGFSPLYKMTQAYGDSCTLWNDILAHPDLDEWWEARNPTRYLKNVAPAVMIVGGLFDAEDCWGAQATYKALRSQSPETDLYLVEGPWAHGLWVRGQGEFFGDVYVGDKVTTAWYMENVEYPFFAYYLEGKGQKPQTGARVFDTGSLEWRTYPDGWPEVDVAHGTPFYLTAGGGLQLERPGSAQAGKVTYVSDVDHPVPFTGVPAASRTREYMLDDQRFATCRPDVAVFRTGVLEQPLSLRGEIEVELQADITTTDADFIVKVVDVFPGGFSYPRQAYQRNGKQEHLMAGYQMMVRWEVMRGKYRDGLDRPRPFVPGESTTVRFTLPDICHTFLPGHRLMIQIQSSMFPLVDRNPQTFCNIYEAREEAFQDSEITIHCGDMGGTSLVRLPLVP